MSTPFELLQLTLMKKIVERDWKHIDNVLIPKLSEDPKSPELHELAIGLASTAHPDIPVPLLAQHHDDMRAAGATLLGKLKVDDPPMYRQVVKKLANIIIDKESSTNARFRAAEALMRLAGTHVQHDQIHRKAVIENLGVLRQILMDATETENAARIVEVTNTIASFTKPK